jgi:hypothetical protein
MQHEHATLIDQLGGGSAIVRALWGDGIEDADRRREAVYKWKRNGIPWRWRASIQKLAQKKRIPLPASFLLPGHDDAPATGERSKSAA